MIKIIIFDFKNDPQTFIIFFANNKCLSKYY